MQPLALSLNQPTPYLPRERRTPSVLATLQKRRKLAITIFALTLSIAIAGCFVIPRTYTASMQFMVNNDRVITPVGTDSSMQAIVYMDDINEARVNTEVSLLSSNDLMLQVVREAGLANVTSDSKERGEQIALKELKEDLKVTPLRKSAIIDVKYRSKDRARAVQVLNILSSRYLDAHVRLHGTPGAYPVFEGLWKDATVQRSAAEAALNEFKRTHDIVSLPEERTLALQRVSDLQRQYADAALAAGRSAKQAQELERILSRTPSAIVGERKTIPNQGQVEHLESILTGLQLKRVEATSRYQPTDRVITDLDQEISQTKAAIEQASSGGAEEVSMIANPVIRDTQSQEDRVRGDLAGYRQEATELGQKLVSTRKMLVELDEEAGTYNLLNDNVTRFAELDHVYRKKADAARLEQSLDANHVSNVTITETPFAPPERSPSFTNMLLLGLLWSTICSFFTVLIVDRARSRVTSPVHVERALGAPVIATLVPSTGAELYGSLPAVYSHILRQPPKRSWRPV